MRLLQAFDAGAVLNGRCNVQSMPFAVVLASPFAAFDLQWQTASRSAIAPGLQHIAAAAQLVTA